MIMAQEKTIEFMTENEGEANNSKSILLVCKVISQLDEDVLVICD